MNLWRLINPFVVLILGSPLHFLASKNLIFITFQGRKSKKTFNIPVSYHREGNDLIALTLKQNLWWKNLKMLNTTQITLLGKKEDVELNILLLTKKCNLSCIKHFKIFPPKILFEGQSNEIIALTVITYRNVKSFLRFSSLECDEDKIFTC